MAGTEDHGFDHLNKLVDQELGPTAWHTITQADINAFADTTGDAQWIHVDVERAKAESLTEAPSPMGFSRCHSSQSFSLRLTYSLDPRNRSSTMALIAHVSSRQFALANGYAPGFACRAYKRERMVPRS